MNFIKYIRSFIFDPVIRFGYLNRLGFIIVCLILIKGISFFALLK